MTDLTYKNTKDIKIIKMSRLIKIATGILVVVAVLFANHILTTELDSAEKYLQQGNMQTASNLKGRIANSIHEMEALSAKMTNEVQNYSKDEIINFLKNHIQDYDYHRLIFAYPDGKTLRYQKGTGVLPSIDWSKDVRFITALSGKPAFIGTEKNDGVPCGYTNSFSVPVYDDKGNIKGVIGSMVDAENYLKILGYNNYDNKGFSFIIREDGDFILTPDRYSKEKDNFFERELKYSGISKDKIKKLVVEEDSGVFSYRFKGQSYIAAFSIIDTTRFYILTTVPLNVLTLNTDRLLWGISFIVILIGVLLIGLLHYSSRIFKENEKIIYKAAFVDGITGHWNKNKFMLEAHNILNHNPDKKYALICVEIKKFKAIEELYGTEHCNKIIRDFNTIINKHLNPGSICARDYSADFAVLYRYDEEGDILKNFIKKLLDEINIYNDHDMQQPSSTGAILSAKLALVFGIYYVNDREITVEQMCQRANIAKKQIKDNALETYNIYDDTLRKQLLDDKEIEDEMYTALQGKQFKMFLQPKYNLATGELAGAEALVRWFHPQKGMIPPMRFIPLFERNGFVIEVDMEIWKQACMFLADRKKNGLSLFPISVNVSRLHMNNDAFIEELVRLIKTYDIEPKYIELELTESACFNNEKRFRSVVEKLKELGFTISMDDFGTGYSSLNMLRHLPIDVLKLDRGFIKDTISDIKGQIVTTSIIEMANRLNMTTVSEGIETEEQAGFLKKIGCKIAQGFLYGKPCDIEEFKKMFLKDENVKSV